MRLKKLDVWKAVSIWASKASLRRLTRGQRHYLAEHCECTRTQGEPSGLRKKYARQAEEARKANAMKVVGYSRSTDDNW